MADIRKLNEEVLDSHSKLGVELRNAKAAIENAKTLSFHDMDSLNQVQDILTRKKQLGSILTALLENNTQLIAYESKMSEAEAELNMHYFSLLAAIDKASLG